MDRILPASHNGCISLGLCVGFFALKSALCAMPGYAAAPVFSEYLRECGIGPVDFARFSDERQIADEELAVIRRIAVRLRDCPADTFAQMMESSRCAGSAPDFRLSESRGNSQAGAKAACGRAVKFRGRIESVEAAGPTADGASGPLFRCEFSLDEPPHRAIVYVAEMPQALRDRSGGADVFVAGILVKSVPGRKDDRVPVVVAPRLERRAAGPLGDFDFDVAFFDGVLDNAPLAAGDSAAFYRLLALGKSCGAEMLREGSVLDAATAASLYHDPAAQRGRLLRVAGIARRAVRVPIDDPALAARLGADHYYEVDLVTAALQDNPLVFCTLELPRDMPLGGPDHYGENVEVSGIFLKTWQFPAALTAAEQAAHPAASQALQTAPLLIGSAPRWKPTRPAQNSSSAWAVAALVALVTTGLGLLLWHLRQSDQEFSARSHL